MATLARPESLAAGCLDPALREMRDALGLPGVQRETAHRTSP